VNKRRLVEIREIAEGLMDEYGLIDRGWTFDFDKAVRRLGCCWYGKRKITLAKANALVDTDDEVLDTILHEIAHALVGGGAGHGPVWQAKCREIGAKPDRCAERTTDKPVGKYVATCKDCGKAYGKARMRKQDIDFATGIMRWGYCPCVKGKAQFTPERRMVWTENEEWAEMLALAA